MLQSSPLYAYLPAKDVKRARAFYEGKLGFVAHEGKGGGVFYEFGNGTAAFLYPTPNAGTNQASTAFWKVGDIEKTVADLKAKGVTFERYDFPQGKMTSDIAEGGGAKAAWFKDSEGNTLAVIQDM
ncbi:MAG TPA: VOC family protein [Polyangiaceae bacterium]